MPHQSENASRLTTRLFEARTLDGLPWPSKESAQVWLFVLPFGRTAADAEASDGWFDFLHRFSLSLHPESVLAILTSAQDAAKTWPRISYILQFQLMVAVKLASPFTISRYELPQQHASMLILSKYRHSLRHTKTRIGYTYCSACDKTTKDYGGKKHTYHEYGTLMSDVWRDISYRPGAEPTDVITRLADLFGMEPYRSLAVVNLSCAPDLGPIKLFQEVLPTARGKNVRPAESRLINDDCLAGLRKLPSNSIEFCFADPPYNLAKRYDSWDDSLRIGEYLTWCDRWLDELARLLRPGCTCAVLNIPLLAIHHFQHMKLGLRFQSWIVWEGLSLPVRMIMPANYAIVCFSKGNPRPLPGLARERPSPLEWDALTTLRENYCLRQSCVSARRHGGLDREAITDLWWDIHRLKHNSRRVDHPCQLPPMLMRRLISTFTYEGEVVLDPFNGSGTTSLCAAALGRRYVGIELSEKYHTLAESRHRLLAAGGNPFEKASGVPTAKNSRVRRIGGFRYAVPKKTLQLEVKRVAHLIGRMPSRADVEKLGRYPIRYYDEYFINWGEVCAAARTTGMSERRVEESPVAVRQPSLFDSIKGDPSA